MMVTVTDADVRRAHELRQRNVPTTPLYVAIARTCRAYTAKLVTDGIFVEYTDGTARLFPYPGERYWQAEAAYQRMEPLTGLEFEI